MLDRAAESSPNTPKYRRSKKGQKIPSQSGLDGRGRAPYKHRHPQCGGGAKAQRGFSPAGSPVGVWGGMNGDTVAEASTLATTLRGRRAQGQIGNRWGHRARPETPDPERGVVGGREGASPPRQPILAGAAARSGFENSKGEAGNAEPQQVLGAGGEASGRGRDPDGDPRAAAGARWEAFPPSDPIPGELGSVPPLVLWTTPIAYVY